VGFILLLLLNCITGADLENIIYVSGKKPANAFVIGKPTKKADWETVPKVRVCASTQLIMSRVDTAVKYWEKLGYEFKYTYKDFVIDCMEPRYGEIIITLPEGNFSAHHMAATRLYTSTRSGKIVMAKIFILPKNGRKERVLEHEIGHALGWSHYSQKTHIMHPDWQYGGYDSKGLRK
jgi:predicted Zn-dependent protease